MSDKPRTTWVQLRQDEGKVEVIELEPVLDLLERGSLVAALPESTRGSAWRRDVAALLREHGRL